MVKFRGVFANLLTAFTSDGRALEPAAQRDYVEWVLARKVHGVSVALTSGEFGYLTDEERGGLIEDVCGIVNSRVPVLANVTAQTLRDTCELAKRAEAAGAAAVMAMPRSYLVLNEAEVLNYYETLLRAIKAPIGIYNNPSATGIDIGGALYEKIIALDPARVVVSKDGSGQLFRTSDVLARCPDFALLQGHARLMLAALLHGAPGTDFVVASLFPDKFVAIYDNVVVHKNLDAAKQAYDRMLPLFRLMLKYDVTRLAKAVAPLLGLKLGPHRAPVLPLPEEARQEMQRVVSEFG